MSRGNNGWPRSEPIVKTYLIPHPKAEAVLIYTTNRVYHQTRRTITALHLHTQHSLPSPFRHHLTHHPPPIRPIHPPLPRRLLAPPPRQTPSQLRHRPTNLIPNRRLPLLLLMMPSHHPRRIMTFMITSQWTLASMAAIPDAVGVRFGLLRCGGGAC